MQLFSNGVGNGTAHAAAHNGNVLQPVQFAGRTERANKVMNGLAFRQAVQLHGGAAHHLEDDGDGAVFAVVIRDCQRDSLGILKGANNDKLPGLGFFCDQRRMDDQFCNGRIQRPSLNNLEHKTCSFALKRWNVCISLGVSCLKMQQSKV